MNFITVCFFLLINEMMQPRILIKEQADFVGNLCFFSDNINLKFAENSEIQGIIDFYKSGCYYQIVDKCL